MVQSDLGLSKGWGCMMKITRVTEEELWEMVEDLLAQYPDLPDFFANACCPFDAHEDFREEYGTSLPAERYEEALFLLGEDVSAWRP